MRDTFETMCALFHLSCKDRRKILDIWDRLERENAPSETRAKLGRFSRHEWNRLRGGEEGVLYSLRDATDIWYHRP